MHELIRLVRPEVVAVELCKERLGLLVDPEEELKGPKVWHSRKVSRRRRCDHMDGKRVSGGVRSTRSPSTEGRAQGICTCTLTDTSRLQNVSAANEEHTWFLGNDTA